MEFVAAELGLEGVLVVIEYVYEVVDRNIGFKL